MNKIDVASFCERGEDGEIDVDLTMDRVLSAVSEYAALQKNDREVIHTALLSLFDASQGGNPKLRANVPALVTMTVNKIGFDASSFGPLQKRAHSVLSESPEIMVTKGPSGGARLRTPTELEYYKANGHDAPTVKIGGTKIEKLEAKLAAAKAAAAK